MKSYTEEQVKEMVQKAVGKTEKSFAGTFKRLKDENERLKELSRDWISVEDEVPEYSIDILLCEKFRMGRDVLIGQRDYTNQYGEHYTLGNGKKVENKITHWMPEPELPEEDKP